MIEKCTPSHDDTIRNGGTKRGRPPKSFEDINERSKKRRVNSLLKSTGSELASVNLRSEGYSSGANLVWKVASSKVGDGSQPVNTFTSYTEDEALALMVSNKLTKHQYLNIRSGIKERGIDRRIHLLIIRL